MKMYYLLFCSVTLLLGVACRQEDDTATATTRPVAAQPASGTMGPHISLDSFQRTSVATLPGIAPARPTPNQLSIRRAQDSVTASGALFAQSNDRKAHAAWRFYFKATAIGCYAYLKEEVSTTTGTNERRSSREAGYCLHFFTPAG